MYPQTGESVLELLILINMNVKEIINNILQENIVRTGKSIQVYENNLADEIYSLVIEYNKNEHNKYLADKYEEDIEDENCR